MTMVLPPLQTLYLGMENPFGGTIAARCLLPKSLYAYTPPAPILVRRRASPRHRPVLFHRIPFSMPHPWLEELKYPRLSMR